jgi:SEC-C motif-containing protein
MKRKSMDTACPCGGASLATCCGPFLDGAPVPDAERLMRSRYTAYALDRSDYLLATWHASTRPERLDIEEPRPRWLGLDVRGARSIDADHATVEFVARYRMGSRGARIHETSRFVREGGRWYYVDGDLKSPPV